MTEYLLDIPRPSLNMAISEAKILLGITTTHLDQKMWTSGIGIIRDLQIDSIIDNHTVLLEMDDNGVVTLPNDYLDWLVVGVLYQGHIMMLSRDERLIPIFGTDSCGNEVLDRHDPVVTTTYGNYYGYPVGSYYYGGYGHSMPGNLNPNGYFHVDAPNGRMFIMDQWHNIRHDNRIVLGYRRNTMLAGSNIPLPEPLVNYVKWKILSMHFIMASSSTATGKRMDMGRVSFFENEANKAYRLWRTFVQAGSLREWEDAINENRQAVK